MKVSELLTILQNPDYADFEVEMIVTEEPSNGSIFPKVSTFVVDDIADIGYSAKIVALSGVIK